MIFDTQSRSRRLPFVGLAISFQAAALWLFMHGFDGYRIHTIVHDIIVDTIPEPKTVDRQPPPEPPMTRPKDVKIIDPIFNTDRKIDDGKGIRGELEQKSMRVAVNPVVPARAAVSIIATHTVPPYPPIARRIGAEGKVTLRLTVTPEGRVSEAEVVTSSGRDDLDQTAQAWIIAHWTYKPALANGVPVASKTLASVTFSLINER
jgi:protein TonB